MSLFTSFTQNGTRASAALAAALAFALAAPGVSRAAEDAPASKRERESQESKDEGVHKLSVGGGISSPSLVSSTWENPAGLVYNRRAKLVGGLNSGPRGTDMMGNTALFLIGNGDVGASLGIQNFSNVGDQYGALSYFRFGIGTYAEPILLAFGLNGSYRFQRKGNVQGTDREKTWTANLGLLFNPKGAFRLGANLYGISQGISAVGVGTAININRVTVLSADASTTKRGKGLTVKPALAVMVSGFQMSYGYGIHIEKSTESGITRGNTLGLGYDFSDHFQVQAYYNQVTTYSLEASIRF